MAYTATKYFSPKVFPYPRGVQSQTGTPRIVALRGNLIENDTATFYTPGGIGSTSFEVTAFSAVGLVTYSSLVGTPLVNGQRVVVYNTSSNTNDGTYIVSQLATTSTTAGTFVAVAIPGKTLAGSAQTSQTAEGVGQIQFGQRAQINQTFTVTAVAFSGGIMTCTYTTLVGPQLQPGETVVLVGMTNAGNNGNFTLTAVFPTSSTGGSFTITNPNAVATDSGTGTGFFQTGSSGDASANTTPIQVDIFSTKGWVYRWDSTNQTIRIFATGASSGTILLETALGATVAFDGTATFEALFVGDGLN